MTSKYTLSAALSYVAITGSKKFLHIRTRLAISEYVKSQYEDLSRSMYYLTDEGMEIARTSRLWKAHVHLLGLGYKVGGRNHHTPRSIGYERWDENVGRTRWGFTGNHGMAYAAEGESAYRTEKVAEFRNGVDE